MPGIKFDTTVETSKVVSGFRDIQKAVHQTAEKVEREGKSIDDVISNIKNSMNIAIGGWTIGKFVNQMMQVRGQSQQTEMAFRTMLQSEEKANDLMKQMIRTAAITPFGVEDVTEGAKQLLAFNVAAEDVNKTLIGLGDVAAGMGLNLKDLVMLYGTTIAKGKMDTMDLYQFLNRGIPIADEIAKVMGLDVTNAIKEVQKQIKEGKVTSDIFIQAMQSMTAEGSKFGGLMEAQSKTITGQISNIEDAIEQMFNELGKSQEGIINTGLSGVSYIVDHWKQVGKVILSVAAAFGTYKAVLLAVIAAHKIAAMAKTAEAFISLAKGITTAKDAMLLFNIATKANPLGLILSLIASAASAFYLFGDSTDEATEKQEKFGESADKAAEKAESLFAILQSASSTSKVHKDALKELKGIADEYGITLSKEGDLTQQLIDKKEALIGVIREEAIERQRANDITDASDAYQKNIQDLKDKIKDTLSDDFSDMQKNQLVNLISEEDIKKITDAYNTMISAEKKSIELTGTWNSRFSNKQIGEYNKTITDLANKIGVYSKALGVSEKSANDAKRAIQNNGMALATTRKEYDDTVNATNKAAAAAQSAEMATDGLTESQRSLSDKTRMAKENVNDLANEIKKMIETYNNSNINIRISYEELNTPPAWMQGVAQKMSSDQLKNLASQHQSRANRMRSHKAQTGRDLVVKNQQGYYTNEREEQVMAGQYAILAQQKKTEEENARRAAEETKKKSTTKKAEDQRKAQEELNKDLKALQQKNTDETISLMQEGTEKKLAEIKNDYAKRKAEIDKQEAEFKKKNKEAGKKEALTSAQSDALSKARDLAAQEYNKKLDDVNREDLTSMRDYLKEYGSLYQKKQAIVEEYEEKIAKAQTEGEKLSLQQQRKKELQTIEINAIRQNIDWGSIFGDFGAMFKDQLEPTIKKLQKLSKSTTDVNEQKTIQELISKLQGSATVWDSDIFKNVSDDINAYQSAMQGYIDAQEREIEATKAVTKAQEDLAKAKKSGDKTSISKAEGNLSRAQGLLATASNNVLEFGSSVQKASSDLQTSAQKAVSQIQQLENGLQGLTSGSLKGIGDSILGLDKLFGGTMQKDIANTLAKGIQGLLGKDSDAAKSLTKALGDSGMAGEIISAVLGILDILKGGFGTLISNLMETVFGAVTGILDDVLSGDIVMKPLKSIGDNVSHILNTLSFGGFNSLFGGDGNAKKVNDTIERLTDRNTLLQQSIEDLTDAMENSYGSKATSYYEQAYKNQQETNQNYLDIAKAQASYYASHGSWNHYWSGFSSDEMYWIKKNVKSDFNGDLFSLSPEEMKLLRGNVAIWEHIENTGKGNYGGRLTEKLNDYIDQAGKLDELSDNLKESLTQISFDSMKDSFVSDLMDMSKSAQDFADDFSEMMQKALLSYSMEDLINGDLKKLYDDWAKAIKDNDGKLTETDIEAFNKRYDDIVQEGLKRRDDLAKVTGYTGSSSSSQTATSGGWASMGQDTADELNGRFTALQIAGESIAQNMTTTISQMESIVTLGISTNGAVLEIRNMMIMTNSYLEDIVKYSKLTYNEFGTKLDDMNRRLKDI